MGTKVIMIHLFSAAIVIFAILSIVSRRILRAAVYLLFVLVATAGLYFFLNYEFLAAMQLALYAGGIVVLIIFSVLLTHHINHKFERPKAKNVIFGAGIAIIGCAVTIPAILSYPFVRGTDAPLENDMKVIGNQLLNVGDNGYALPFEVISILLLAALISGIIIAKKAKK